MIERRGEGTAVPAYKVWGGAGHCVDSAEGLVGGSISLIVVTAVGGSLLVPASPGGSSARGSTMGGVPRGKR